ncbi:MAG TPA: PAC2 family protein [Phycisphaerales bacterium]|nr:PAC2 family protein [Phycisphaerales bacterium]
MAKKPETTPRKKKPEGPRPWMVAAWPGMGNVAVIAAGYLVQELEMRPVAELFPRGHFDIQQVTVKEGVIVPPHMPRSVIYKWKNPVQGGRDLYVFLGEAQPTSGTYSFAHELLDRAAELNIERVITFASLASQLHPSSEPRVVGAATDQAMLDELKRLEVRTLEDGQIGGLNGVILGAASQLGISGMCLLGEIPFFAAAVPNPKAASAVLDVFNVLGGVSIDMDELNGHAKAVEEALVELMERMKQTERGVELEEIEDDEEPEIEEGGEATGIIEKPEPVKDAPERRGDPVERGGAEREPKLLDFSTKNRIEQMFVEARKDRGRAMRLKDELDRLGAFKQYEDRFLDLFKRAE